MRERGEGRKKIGAVGREEEEKVEERSTPKTSRPRGYKEDV